MDRVTKYVITAGVGLLVGLCFGGEIGRYVREPNKVYVKDVNKDGIEDLVIESNGGERFLYLGNKDGEYKKYSKLDLVIDFQHELILDKIKNIN